ncbi:MAG: pantetheine-phosphate adenylyltransferase [bacterium]
MKRSAIYAGTFDPITLGHLDLLHRASLVFDKVLVAVAECPRKSTMFSVKERCEMVRQASLNLENVTVKPFSGLLVHFARKKGIHVLVRGLRAYSDFEYEFQMALTNRQLAPDLETLFLMPKETHSYLSSSVVREIAELGGNIRRFVPACVLPYVRRYTGRGGNAARSRGQRTRD